MTTETMTVHRALVELKNIDKRIQDTIENTTFVSATKHGDKVVSGIPLDDFKKNAVAAYSKIVDLVNRRNAIKAALSKSNAVTQINVGGTDYTVAEAIAMKQHGMELWAELRDQIKHQLDSAMVTINRNNSALDKAADDFITNVYGGKESAKSIDPEALEQARKGYIEARQYELRDGLDSRASSQRVVEDFTDMINTFNDEIDSALSVSNATTTIKVSY